MYLSTNSGNHNSKTFICVFPELVTYYFKKRNSIPWKQQPYRVSAFMDHFLFNVHDVIYLNAFRNIFI